MKPFSVHRSAAAEVVAVPIGADNYAYILATEGGVAVVDPGQSAPIMAVLRERGWTVTHILVTHTHQDHIGGLDDLRVTTGAVIAAPSFSAVEPLSHPMAEGDQIHVGGLEVRAIDTPGHCASHVAYHVAAEAVLFSGDALFTGGCGRLLGQRPELLFHSLRRLAALPDETKVLCGHEYALENLRFAVSTDPTNAEATKWLREVEELRRHGQPAIPSTLGREKQVNPFLRAPDVPSFARLRARKDVY